MNRFRKIVSVFSALVILAALPCSNAMAESKSAFKSSVILESNYDQAIMWNNGALFIKNCSVENTYQITITNQSEMVFVRQDGTTSDFKNTQKFDKIFAEHGIFDECFTASSCYLIVGKDGKKALLKEDGSIAGNTWYDDIFSATEHFAMVKEGDKVFVRNLNDPSKEYSADSSTHLEETENSLRLISDMYVTELLDKSLNKIDLSKYSQVDDIYNKNIPYGGYLRTSAGNGKYGILSETGKEIVPAKYTNVAVLAYKGENYFYAENDDSSSEPINFTVFKNDGTVFIGQTSGRMTADDLDSSEGYAVYYQDNGYGIYDFNTRSVKVEPTYQSIKAYDSRCFAYTTDGKLGVKSYDNKDIIACGQYPKVPFVSISDDRIVVNTQDEQGVFTSYVYASDTGKIIFSYKSDEPNYYLLGYHNGVAEYVYFYYFSPVGAFDKNGKEVVSPFSYGYIAECCTINGQTLFAGHNGKIGILDSQGLPVTDFKYDNLGKNHGESFRVSADFGNENQKFFLTVENNKYGLIEITPAVKPGLSLDKTAAVLKAGETLTLTPTLTPADSSRTFRWTSSDESVATVKDGVVTALKPGTATITAMAGDVSAACTVTVTDNTTAGSTANTTATQKTAITEEPSSTGSTSAEKSPATGDNPLGLEAVLAILTISALAVTIVRKKRA